MFEQLLRLVGRKPRQPSPPIELTVADQWVLKALFNAGKDRHVTEEHLVQEVLVELPTVPPQEVRDAARKLAVFGITEQNEIGAYKVAAKGRRLKGILPERPTVNMDIYE